MKVIPKKELNKLAQGKGYLALGIDADSLHIVGDTGDPYLYKSTAFENIDPNEPDLWQYEIG